MDKHREWTARQTELRKLIVTRACFEDAIALFLRQHAETHGGAVGGAGVWSLQDEALAGLSEAQIRFCPPREVNSIAWNLWHVTRIEDMTLTALVLEQPQLLDGQHWLDRLGLDTRDCGAGMSAAQVQDFSARVNIPALLAYRAAVGLSTRAGVCELTAEDLRAPVPASTVMALQAEGSIAACAGWLVDFYMNRKKGFFLTRTATSHNCQHVSAAWRLAKQLRG